MVKVRKGFKKVFTESARPTVFDTLLITLSLEICSLSLWIHVEHIFFGIKRTKDSSMGGFPIPSVKNADKAANLVEKGFFEIMTTINWLSSFKILIF